MIAAHGTWFAIGIALSIGAPFVDGWPRVVAFALPPAFAGATAYARALRVECRDRLAWMMIVIVGTGSATTAAGNVLEIDLGHAEVGHSLAVVGLGVCCIGATGAATRFASGLPLTGRLAARSRYMIVAVPALLTLGAQWVRAMHPLPWKPFGDLHVAAIAVAVGGLFCATVLSMGGRERAVSPSNFRLLGSLACFVVAGTWAPAFTTTGTRAVVLMVPLGAAHGLLAGAAMHPSMATAGSPHGANGALGLLGPLVMLIATVSTFVAVAVLPGPIPTYVIVMVSTVVVGVAVGCGATLVRSGPTGDIRAWLDPRRRSLVDDFVQALAHGHLTLFYQPIIRLHDGRPVGAEALVRWRHPERGLLGAGEVLHLATASRHDDELNAWVVGQIARDMEVILGCLDVDEPLVTFNVSPAHLRPGFASMVANALISAGTAPDGMAVELTEVDAYVLDERMIKELAELQELGVLVAIDDFGTGTSNIGVLVDIDADVLKIDRRLVTGDRAKPRREGLLTIAIELGRCVGALVVLEGIETDDELAAVMSLGAQYAQGFVFAPPMPLAELVSYAATHAAGAQRGGPTIRPR